MLKVTILSISLLTVFGSAAIAPALAEIAKAFPDIPATQIKALLTAPALAMVFVSPITGWLAHKVGQKRLLIFGLCCYAVGGIGGGFAADFQALFGMRLLLGVGIGILMPMSSGLIAQYYAGKERLQLMGWSSSVTSFFGVVANLLVGFLAVYSWRYGFGVYCTVFLVLLLVFLYIPGQDSIRETPRNVGRLPPVVYLWALAIFLQMLAIYAVPVNISLFLTDSGIGGSRETGMAVACLTAASFFAGLLGVRVRAMLGKYFTFILLLLGAVGYEFLATANSLTAVIVALFAVGLGNGFLMPYLFYCATSSVKSNRVVGAMGVMATAVSLGQFATPLLLDGMAHLLGDTSTQFVFQFVGVAVAIAAFILLLAQRFLTGGAKDEGF